MGGCWVSNVTNWSCVIKTGLLIKTWKLLLPDDFLFHMISPGPVIFHL